MKIPLFPPAHRAPARAGAGLAADATGLDLRARWGMSAPALPGAADGSRTHDTQALLDGPPPEQRVHDLERREREVERRELDAHTREKALVARLEAAQAILLAAHERDAVADTRDALADSRDRDLDLASMLITASDHVYGGTWPERRHAALDRELARSDRLAARLDLTALVVGSLEVL